MGIFDRDYYREKRDYQDLILENQKSLTGYLFKKLLKALFSYVLTIFFLILLFAMISNNYGSWIKSYESWITSWLKSNLKTFQKLPSDSTKKHESDLESDHIDWSEISSCISNKTDCICYSKSSERLSIPPETCRDAVKRGWSSQSM